jgi:hypothetical protein
VIISTIDWRGKTSFKRSFLSMFLIFR